MHHHPILSAIYRNKVGALLIAVQITVTLAIICNALFIVRQRLTQMYRPSGIDEADTFFIDNQWIGNPADLAARVRTDLNALRAIRGVEGAYVTNAYPFENSGWGFGFSLHRDGNPGADAAVYLGDEQTLRTLGLRLISGRNFSSDDVVDYKGITDRPATSGVIITRALAEQLVRGGGALGRQVTMVPTLQSALVVGIIDKLQAPWAALVAGPDVESSAILPYRYVSSGSYYVVRARPGQVDAAMRAARDKLFAVNRARVIGKVQSIAQARHYAERINRAPVIMLSIVGGCLLAVTAFGIVGLASFWVIRRRRQIGIRRALGATRFAIVRHFQLENLLITLIGAAVGVALAVAANLWMVSSFSMNRLPISYLVTGVVIMLALGQLAVLWPALRAASVPPAEATRAS